MKSPISFALLQGLWALLLQACHLDLVYPSHSSDLDSFLGQSPCPSLSLDLPPTSNPVLFTSMGDLSFLRLNCDRVTLVLQTTLLIQPDAEIWLSSCALVGGAGLGLIDVQGNLTLQDCSVRNHSGYGFLIEGRVLVQSSLFAFNQGPVFLASQLGIHLTVQHCRFQNNESPLGTVLHLSVSSLNALSTTRISFEDSIFSNNSAALGGAFMHVSIKQSAAALDFPAAQQRQLLVSNCEFSDNSGSLWHLFLTYMQAVFVNNTISNATVPLHLQLYDNSLLLENTTITSVEKAIICPHINGHVMIRNMRVYNSSEGPALLFSHTAPSSPGQVTISGLELRYASQTDFSLYTSTVYVFNVPVTVENLWVQHSFSFAAACGAFFFTESLVRNCTFADSLTHQGGLIGHIGGRGTASRLVLKSVRTESSGAVLTMRAQVNFSHIYFNFTSSESIPVFDNLLVFLSSVVTFTDVDLNLPATKSELIIKVMLSEVHLAQINFKLLHLRTFFQSITSNVTLWNVSAEAAELSSFALIYAESSVNISQVVMRNWVIGEGLVSAKSTCSVELSHIEISDCVCEALVHSFYSQVHLTQVVLNNTKAGTLFSAYVGGEILVNDMQISHSTCNLVLCESGLFTMAFAQLTEVKILKRLVTLRNATANLQSVDITGLYATTVSPLVLANYNSTLQLSQSVFKQIKSSEQGLMQLSNSRLLLDFFSLSDFNASFAVLSRCKFSVFQTQVAHGGAQIKRAGFIQAEDSQGLVSVSRFHSIFGTSGGSFAFLSSTVEISDAYFQNCSAQFGGVISAISTSLHISHCTFHNNSASIGGVIYFQCDTESKCPALLEASEFANNSAVEGGVLKWTQVKPLYAHLTYSNNTAVYGDFEASLPTHIALVGNTSVLYGVAGIRVIAPIVIAALDAMNQTVRTDNDTIMQLMSESLRGTTYLPAVNGFASFSGVIVDTPPGTSIQIQAFSPSIQQTFPTSSTYFNFTYYARECVSGEISLPLSCFLCPKNTYSLFPSDTFCHDCPHYASCPGGNVLVLDSGYWRASELSTDVFLCPNPDACEGGLNATCSAGYSGELCSACAEDYYMLGTVSCQECEGVAVIFIRSFIICLVVIGLFTYLSNQTSLKPGQLASIRIIANFLHFLLVLPLIPVNWQEAMTGFLSFTEMVVSFGQTSFSLDCWMTRETYSSAVYWKAVLATAFPVLLFFLVFATSCIQDRCISRKQVARAIAVSMFLLWWTQPYVLKAVITLLSCKRQVNHWVLGCDPAVICWEGTHLKFALALSLPALILYGVAYQVCFYMILSRKSLLTNYKLKVHFYTAGLEKKYRLWETFNALKKEMFIISTAVLQATDNIFQVLIVAIGLYVVLTCFIASKEHIVAVLHRLTGYELLLEVFLYTSSYYFVARLGLKYYLLTLLSCITTTISIVFLLVCFVQIRRLRVVLVANESREVPQESNEASFNESPFVPPQSPASLPSSGIRADSISVEISATH